MRDLINKNYIVSTAIMVLLVASTLAWMTFERINAYQQYHMSMAHKSIGGVEKQVAIYIAEKKRLVGIFAADNSALINKLSQDPDNDALHDRLGKLVTRSFPERFAFSVAGNLNLELFEDFDGLISGLCLEDIRRYSAGEPDYRPYIHPNNIGYHFDIMVRYGKDGKGGVFFVSFLADVLGNIIKSIEGPGHKIMLIDPERNHIIEVVAGGARNTLDRQDYRLTEDEQSLIDIRHDIPGTRWQAVNMHESNTHDAYAKKLIIESTVIFIIFATVALLLVVRLRKEERHRDVIEDQKKALLSIISHEFRSPVSVIKGSLDAIVADENEKMSEVSAEYMNMAVASSSRLLNLVNDFLEIQKIESGNLQYSKQDTQLGDTVKKAIEDISLYAEIYSVQFHLLEPVADDYVNCDPNRIGQVMTNLLTNAAKYGGEEDVINITVWRVRDSVRVSVTDHGPGIPEEFQKRVFDKFTMHARDQGKKFVDSTGLGLNIAKVIIEAHDGVIGFDTKINEGTTFWFELPIVSHK